MHICDALRGPSAWHIPLQTNTQSPSQVVLAQVRVTDRLHDEPDMHQPSTNAFNSGDCDEKVWWRGH